jgi:transposase
VSGNRRRVRRAKGKALQRRRSEVCERTFAHICETGGARRTWLRGLVDVGKRYVIAAAAHNLGRLLRRLTGAGKPKAVQGDGGLAALANRLVTRLRTAATRLWARIAGASNWFRTRPAA